MDSTDQITSPKKLKIKPDIPRQKKFIKAIRLKKNLSIDLNYDTLERAPLQEAA